MTRKRRRRVAARLVAKTVTIADRMEGGQVKGKSGRVQAKPREESKLFNSSSNRFEAPCLQDE